MHRFSGFHAPVLVVIHKSSQAEKSRHFGRDAEIQAMDGIRSVAQVLDLDHLPTCSYLSFVTGIPVAASSLPSLDAGFRHPCRNDGPPTLCV